MADQRREGLARYENVDETYLARRTLRKSAGWGLLWALGVGAVISGDYFGWNFGLSVGGFSGLAIATVLMAAMYLCMVFTIAELSACLPHAGGFYSFVRNALGPTAGYICGVTDTIEYVLTPAVIVVGIGGYMNAVIPGVPLWLWWLLAYAIFIGINIYGVELTLRVALIVTAIAAGVLLLFFAAAVGSGAFKWDLLFNISPSTGNSYGLPFGAYGIFAAIPFAIWFFLAIEQLPLAAEETHDVVNDMPKALILGIVTLLFLALCTLVINSGVGGGAAQMGKSDAPLADGFKAVFGVGVTATLTSLIALTGLIASFHAVIYAYGRVLFALSRAGYFPRWISLVNRRHTPHIALILGGVGGRGCAVLIEYFGNVAGEWTAGQWQVVRTDQNAHTLGAALLSMAVFGAVISYALVMVSYIVLRLRRPNLERPYRSPLGITGAASGASLSIVALIACFAVEENRLGVVGTAVFLFLGVLYYVLHSRHRLVAQAPEEEVALTMKSMKELDGATETNAP